MDLVNNAFACLIYLSVPCCVVDVLLALATGDAISSTMHNCIVARVPSLDASALTDLGVC